MKKRSIMFFLLLFTLTVNAQWTQRASFPSVARAKCASFTIGNKLYMMGGITNAGAVLNDFWEYDMTADTWTQKANFPGDERYGAASFTWNGYGFISCGGNDFGYLTDIWQYNPVTNVWVEKIGLPNTQAQDEYQRREPFSFVIGNKAYLGGGDGFVFGPNSTSNYAFHDLWEFDIISNSWTQKADIPDFLGRTMSVGCAMNGKGYVGLGCDVSQTTNRRSMWEYEPTTDTWTALQDFPNDFTTDGSTFVIDSTLYLVGGVNLNPVSLSSQVYKYEPFTNSWTAISSFGGGAFAGGIAGSNGVRSFAGLGYNSSIVPRNGFWEFTPVSTSVNEIISNFDVVIYPNPAKNYLSLESKEKISGTELIDFSGKKVLEVNNEVDKIDVSMLSVGVYTIKIRFVDQSVQYKKIIKQE